MEEVKEFMKQCQCLTSHNQQLYAILWGQSLESIHAKVEAHPGFDEIRMDSDGVHLLNEIELIMLNVQEQRYLLLSIHQTKYNVYHLLQGKQSLEQYYQWFNMLVHVLEPYTVIMMFVMLKAPGNFNVSLVSPTPGTFNI